MINLSQEELEDLAFAKLANSEQARLSALLAKNAESQLSPDEDAELDRILEHVDHLNLLKAQARYILHQRQDLREVTQNGLVDQSVCHHLPKVGSK